MLNQVSSDRTLVMLVITLLANGYPVRAIVQLESYILAHSEANFSRGVSTNCYKKFFKRVAAA